MRTLKMLAIKQASTTLAVAIWAVVSSLTIAASPTAHAQDNTVVIYRENYKHCTGTEGREAVAQAGWKAFVPGRKLGQPGFMKVFTYGTRDVPTSINSNPIGFAEGYTFWFRPVTDLLTFTDEFAFDVSVLRDPAARVEWVQRLSGVAPNQVADSAQLAVLVDGTWFISQERVAQTNLGTSWEMASFAPAGLTYGVTQNVPNRGPQPPTVYDRTLPETGTVRAFGTYVSVVNGRVRFDNYTIRTTPESAGAIPLAETPTNILACPASSPDRGGVAPPTPGPDDPIVDKEGEDDETPGGTPDAPVLPTPIGGNNPSTSSISFCPEAERTKGPRVAFSRAALRQLLKVRPTMRAIPLRDTASIALLSRRKFPMGALANVRISDYDPISGVVNLPVGRNGAVIGIRLSTRARKVLDLYLKAFRTGASPEAPLLLARAVGTKNVTSQSAACLKEVRRGVRSRARALKVNSQVKFVRAKSRR